MSSKNSEILNEFQEDSLTIVTSTMFKLKIPGEYSEKYHYSRYGNPTRDLLESSLASLDSANHAVTYCSGTAAYMAALSIMKPDDSVVFSDVLKCQKFKKLFTNLKVESMNFECLKKFEDLLNPNTRMVWIDSSTTPFMTVLDIKAIADVVHEKSDAILVVDNSFLGSYFQKPLELGADIAVYSLNEYIGGHDDVSMGAVVTNDKTFYEKLRYYQVSAGTTPSPIDCYMINRSLKTLSLRIERHFQNSVAVAKFLKLHPKVEKVFHPSLQINKPGCKVEGNNFFGHSGVLSFYINGEFKESQIFLMSLKLIKIAQNLGGVDSTVLFPWTMSHAELPEQQRIELGITQNLITLSVGVENLEKIIEDLDEALKYI